MAYIKFMDGTSSAVRTHCSMSVLRQSELFRKDLKEHKKWLADDQDEKDVAIYLGRVYDPLRHSEKDKWKSWEEDIKLAEKIIIYKYSPNYNGRELTSAPNLTPHKIIRLIHLGKRHKLKPVDEVPRDFYEW